MTAAPLCKDGGDRGVNLLTRNRSQEFHAGFIVELVLANRAGVPVKLLVTLAVDIHSTKERIREAESKAATGSE